MAGCRHTRPAGPGAGRRTPLVGAGAGPDGDRPGQEHGADRPKLHISAIHCCHKAYPGVHHRLPQRRLHAELHRFKLRRHRGDHDSRRPADGDAKRGQRRRSGLCAVHADRPGDLHRRGRANLRCAGSRPVPNAEGAHDVLCRDRAGGFPQPRYFYLLANNYQRR